MRKISAALLCFLFLTACSSTDMSSKSGDIISESEKNSSEPEKVSVEEVGIAAKSIEINVDEFEGSTDITSKVSYLISDPIFGIGVSLGIFRESQQDAWSTTLITMYVNEDWMFHDRVNLKSSAGILSFDIDSSNRDNQVRNGFVVEGAYYKLTSKEALNYCEIIEGKNVKLRLRGWGGAVSELVKDVPDNIIQSQRDLCTVYFGLRQGMDLQE